jgi:hypothetical protein
VRTPTFLHLVVLLVFEGGCATGLDDGLGGGEVADGGASSGGSSPTAGGGGAGASGAGGSATGGGPAVGPGDLVISEILANPDAVADTYGEWIEIYNSTSAPIDLQGLVFRHEANDPVAVHVIGASVVAPPQGYAVIGKSTDQTLNGGVAVAYAYPADIGFTNTGDYLAIERADETIIDHTFWASDAPLGASLSLDPAFLDASLNDDATHFCAGVALLPSGDRGTPGAPNPACP